MTELYEITLKTKLYRILFVTDVHLADEEFKNTIGYVEAQEKIILRLIEGAEKGLFNTVIFLGDLFDRPYKDVAKTLYHISLLEHLHNLVEGRMFKVFGNHPMNKRRNYSPTFFLTGAIKSGRVDKSQGLLQTTADGLISNYGLTNPILYTPDRIHVNGTLINLFHYNKTDKNYFDNLKDLVYKPKKHIGCYHDTVMTEQVRYYVNELSNGNKFTIPTSFTVEGSGIFSNVDYAMVGDIHTKIGEFKVTDTMTGITTVVDIPGSLGRTANHRAQQHNDVYLPLLEITENGEVTKEHVHVPLIDFRKIFKVDLQEEEKEHKNKMEDFKSAIEILQTPDSFKEAIEKANFEQRTKDILNDILDNDTYEISYRKKALERGLL